MRMLDPSLNTIPQNVNRKRGRTVCGLTVKMHAQGHVFAVPAPAKP